MQLREANVTQDDQGELVQLVNSCDRLRYGATLENVLTWLTWPSPAAGNLVQFSWPNVLPALRQPDAMDEVHRLPYPDLTAGTQAMFTSSSRNKRMQMRGGASSLKSTLLTG